MMTLEKQLNWGIKVYFKRKKYDHSTALKRKNRIMSVEFLLKYRCMVFFLKYVRKNLPVFSNNYVLQTSNCKQNARTGKVYPAMKSNSEFLYKSLMLQATKLYNEFPHERRQKLDKVKNIKGFLKEFYFKEYLKDPKVLEYRDLLRDLFNVFIVFNFLIIQYIFLMFLVFQTLQIKHILIVLCI